MHVEKKRIFVGNLPPYVDENEIKKQFSHYGNVVSVDIKQRKGGNADENVSPVFAFVNIEIDDRILQKCFQEIADYNWQGYYVNLQLAKESFLDRLKREREEAQAKNNENNSSKTEQQILAPPPNSINRKAHHHSESDDTKSKQNGQVTPGKMSKKKDSSSSSSSDDDDSDDEPAKQNNKLQIVKKLATKKESSSSSADSSDSSDEKPKNIQNDKQTPVDPIENDDDDFKLVIKSNKHKVRGNGGLKIESVNSTPIHVITKKGTKNEIKDQKSIEADLKRKQSLIQMKNSYNQQKLAIKNALSNVDTKSNKTPDQRNIKKRDYGNDEYSSAKRQKLSLFDDEGEEDNDNIDFSVKHQFEGRKGQRLLEIQSRYNKDSRFALDERFADDEDAYEMEGAADDEKEKQLEILESVLGQKVRKDFRDDNKTSNIPKGMLRYDPSKPEHSKFQIKRDEYSKKDRKKDKKEFEKEKVESAPIPEVSKEKFYEVKGDLKESLKEKEGFSLLSMFGRAEEKDDNANEYEAAEEIKKNNKYDYERNPFKYDSSDTEDDEPNKQKKKQKQKKGVESQPAFRWAESFFFEPNDNRLKDGLEFLKNLSTNSESFKEKRRALQRIVYGKAKNVERDKRKFQNKLRKRIKVKKAIRKS